MTDTNKIIDDILHAEGGYTNDPTDPGGETNFGITAVTARANGYYGPMRFMPESTARTIYEKKYITAPGFDKYGPWPELASELVDTGVNMGPGIASKFFQHSLNLFNDGDHYAILSEDGNLGPATMAAFQGFLKWRGQPGIKTLVKTLNILQGARYIEIVAGNPSQKKYIFGWITNRIGL